MSTKLKKIVLESMLASKREATLNRVAYLMDESWLESIVDGIIIDAKLKDNALSLIKKRRGFRRQKHNRHKDENRRS